LLPPARITASPRRYATPGGDQSLANDRHCGNQHHDRVAKACQRLPYRQHAAQTQRQDHEDCDNIGTRASQCKQRDGASQNAEYREGSSCHRVLLFER